MDLNEKEWQVNCAILMYKDGLEFKNHWHFNSKLCISLSNIVFQFNWNEIKLAKFAYLVWWTLITIPLPFHLVPFPIPHFLPFTHNELQINQIHNLCSGHSCLYNNSSATDDLKWRWLTMSIHFASADNIFWCTVNTRSAHHLLLHNIICIPLRRNEIAQSNDAS